MGPSKVVLLSCGSFNPTTLMHLRMFELARDYLQRTQNVEVIKGVMSPVNDGYAKKGLVAAQHRGGMCRAATASSDWIIVDDWEAGQSEYQRTLEVLRKVARDFNVDGKEPVQVRLLCGADLLDSFRVPGLWQTDDMERILGQHGIVCITRAGSDPSKIIYDIDRLYHHQNHITIVTEWISNDVSSTKVRKSLQRNESVKYLVPDPVCEYIRTHGLYANA
eukprot:comp19456_c0_seq1/m.22625 comp19456_c0_seq1/g.22625  ORF comp19456_c0_seq1/g.22625 comp19456_c0_seq1/m.22625 type:complete len:220 (-) comp19456_c0_seq1:138-797(-)